MFRRGFFSARQKRKRADIEASSPFAILLSARSLAESSAATRFYAALVIWWPGIGGAAPTTRNPYPANRRLSSAYAQHPCAGIE